MRLRSLPVAGPVLRCWPGREVVVTAVALLCTALGATARGQDVPVPPGSQSESDPRAARRELMRQFAQEIVAAIRARMHEGVDYPPEALANRWEGTVQLAILYPWGGGPERIDVHRTSGYPALDRKALEIVGGMQLPARPDALRGVEFDVTFPIGFRVAESRRD